MIRWKERIRKMQFMVVDLVLMALAFVIAYSISSSYLAVKMPKEMEIAFFVVTAMLVTVSVFRVANNYDEAVRCVGVFELKHCVKTGVLMGMATLMVSGVIYLIEHKAIHPNVLITYYIVSTVLVIYGRLTLRILFRNTRRKSSMNRRILVVGYSERGKQYIDYMREQGHLNIDVVGYISIKTPEKYDGIKHLGSLSDLMKIVQEHAIDEIAVAKPLSYDVRLNSLLEQCQGMGITLTMLLELQNGNSGVRAQVAMYGDLPTLKFHTVSLNETQLLMKRILDVVGSSVGLILFGIAYVIVGPIIKLETPGPVIFKQKRVGMNGRVFEIWKFRSMGVNAEAEKAALMANNEMSGHMFKMSADPRITKVGAFIRKTSIDELPQFWNVFRGDMSLVGTRPPTVNEVKEYELHHHRRISITPGITGNWQVSGRSDIEDFEEVVRLDTDYIDGWTVWTDIEILLQTVLVVLTKRGSK